MGKLLSQIFLFYVCSLTLAGQALADSLAAAGRAYIAGNFVKAAKIFIPLAQQGNAAAQFNLGVMYSYGQGVPQDYKEAVKWYRMAAAQGAVDAQETLGLMYMDGTGVPQDYVLSHMWLAIAAANADDEEQQVLMDFLKLVAKQMTASQLAEAQALARKCTANKFKEC